MNDPHIDSQAEAGTGNWRKALSVVHGVRHSCGCCVEGWRWSGKAHSRRNRQQAGSAESTGSNSELSACGVTVMLGEAVKRQAGDGRAGAAWWRTTGHLATDLGFCGF